MAVALIWVVMALEIANGISSYFYWRMLAAIRDAGPGMHVIDGQAELREAFLGLAYMVVLVVSAITFIQWFRRACHNLNTLVGNMTDAETWAALGWFVPILNLFKPYQVMRELYRRTILALTSRGLMRPGAITTRHVGWWWAFWVTSAVIGQVSFRISMHAEDLDERILSAQFSVAECLVGVPLAVLAVSVVRKYAGMEDLLANIPVDQPPPAPEALVA